MCGNHAHFLTRTQQVYRHIQVPDRTYIMTVSLEGKHVLLAFKHAVYGSHCSNFHRMHVYVMIAILFNKKNFDSGIFHKGRCITRAAH